MFHDRKQELERLSEELWEDIEEELTEEEIPEDENLLSEETLNQLLDIDVHNADKTDVGPDELSEEIMRPEPPRLTGLILTATLLSTGICLLLLWWVLRYFGVL